MNLRIAMNKIFNLKKSFSKDKLPGYYRIRIINRSREVIWLAKNTVGNLHDIIPPGKSLEIRSPIARKIEFYAYKASHDLVVSGLNYYDRRSFTHDDYWIIQ